VDVVVAAEDEDGVARMLRERERESERE